MIFYFSWFIITFLLLSLKKGKNSNNVIIVFILFTLVYGCRNHVGIDDIAYMSAFNDAINGNIVYGMEKSFLVISKFAKIFGFNYKFVFLVYASISFTFMYLAYKELCENKYEWIVAILGFFVFSSITTITAMRQFVAAAIITYALTLTLKNKNKLSLILIGLACTFHLGSVIGFALFPLFLIKLKTKMKILLPLGCFIIGYFGYFVFLLNKLNFLIPQKYFGYVDGYVSAEPHVGILHIILITIYILQFVLLSINKVNKPSDKTIDFLERGQMLYFSLFFITLSSGWASRLFIYLTLFVPFIFKTFNARFLLKRDKQMLYIICYLMYMLLFVYQIINLQNSFDGRFLIPYNGSFNFMQ